MPKKCPPGVICVENITLVLIFFIIVVMGYLFYSQYKRQNKDMIPATSSLFNTEVRLNPLASISSRNDPFNDPYSPPLKKDGYYHPTDSGDVRGVPVNIQTRGLNLDYEQMGILTRLGGGDLILPLMGRRTMTGRDKYEYYAISNTGNINTKLPISVNGKSCTSEYGCDDINNGDTVYVQGYNDAFQVTMYENSNFRYIPYL